MFSDPRSGQLSSSASNVNATPRLSLKPHQDFLLTKTHSATNVFSRPSPAANRNSLNSMDSVQYNTGSLNSDVTRYSYGAAASKQSSDKLGAFNSDLGAHSDIVDGKGSRYGMRRGSSVENVNSSTLNLNANGGLKKVKYENEVSMKKCNFIMTIMYKHDRALGDSNHVIKSAVNKRRWHNKLSRHILNVCNV